MLYEVITCNLCQSWVKFVIARDPAGTFRFASLQSTAAAAWLKPYPETRGVDSIVLLLATTATLWIPESVLERARSTMHDTRTDFTRESFGDEGVEFEGSTATREACAEPDADADDDASACPADAPAPACENTDPVLENRP